MIVKNVATVSSDSDYYQILGITENASIEDIQVAYERELEATHVESLASYSLCPEEVTEERLLQLSMAYMKLADPDARLKYDQERQQVPEQTIEIPQISVTTKTESGATDTWKSRIRKVIYLRSSNPESRKLQHSVKEVKSANFSEKEVKIPENSPDNSPRDIDSKTLRERQNVFRNLNQKNTSSQNKLESFFSSLNSQTGTTTYNGLVLKQIREIKSISIDELATVTCVRRIYLEGIEEEDFVRFSSAVYFKGYLQCYAKAMELPVEQVMTDFKALIESVQWS